MNRSWMVGLGIGAVFVSGTATPACTGNPQYPYGSGGSGAFETSSFTGVSTTFAVTGSTVAVTTGGFSDICGKYFVDAQTTSEQCGIATSPGPVPICTDASEASLDTCLDKCLPLVDCGCTKNPSGPGCATKLAPYANCTASCQAANGTSSTTTATTGVSSSSTTVSVSSATSTSASTGAGGNCSTGTPGTHNDPQCETCWGCASDAQCKPQRIAFMQAPNAGEWLQCAQGCLPDNPSTPANEFQACVATCSASYPGAESQYLAFLDCVACQTCSTECNSMGYFGSCSEVAPF